MNQTTRNAAVIGAGGFVGAELLRLILPHPHLELVAAVSESQAGQPIGARHAALAPWTEQRFVSGEQWAAQSLHDGPWTIFAAFAHGDSMQRLPELLDRAAGADVQLIDLSGDFRLHDPSDYPRYYRRTHVAPELLQRFVYGLPELHREQIAKARCVANPGCFATCTTLAVLPAAAASWRVLGVALDGMTGSSGAGAHLRETTHHPRRANNLEAYKRRNHQHLPEVRQCWVAAGGDAATPLSFVPHRAPLVRGIYVSAHIFLADAVSTEAAAEQYRSFYRDAAFVRVLDDPPSIVDVWGSNRCDLSVTEGEGGIVVSAAIDNLVKGAAGQAVQNANIMNGWGETAGLIAPMPWPL